MKTTRQFLLVSAVSVLLGSCMHPQTQERLQNVIQRAPDTDAQKINCSGTVTDSAGSPLAGATVEYWRYEGLSGPVSWN
jgi:protocatechuate 3,4-dioxygenase beta subunit